MTSDTDRSNEEAAVAASPLPELVSDLRAENEGLGRELEEIELLLQQARTEA